MMLELGLFFYFWLVLALAKSHCNPTQRTITVQSSGVDNSSCIDGTHSCLTLSYTLEHVMNCTTVVVLANQTIPRQCTLAQVHNLSITSNGSFVTCSKGGLHFYKASYITIQGVHWIGDCNSHEKHMVMLRFDTSANVLINNSNFTSSCAAVHMTNMTRGSVSFQSCFFNGHKASHNSSVAILQNSSQTIGTVISFLKCSFINCSSDHFGGAVSIQFLVPSINNSINIENCSFIGNRAIKGGHVAFNASNTSGNVLMITHSNFSRGNATISGGALLITLYSTSGEKIRITSCRFLDNNASVSGTIHYTQSGDNFLYLKDCTFKKNYAKHAPGITMIQYAKIKDHQPVVFTNCNWSQHHLPQLSKVGCVSTSGIPLMFNGTNMMVDSFGCSALYINDAVVTFKGNITFENISSIGNGGAIHLDGKSHMVITEGLVLRFSNTSATYGGAIFYAHKSVLVVHDHRHYQCVFEYKDCNATVLFDHTVATAAGDSIYLNNPNICSKEKVLKIFGNKRVFQDLKLEAISSPPVGSLVFKKAVTKNGTFFMDIMLGEMFKFHVLSKNIIGNNTLAVTTMKLQCSNNANVSLSEDQKVLVFGNFPVKTNIHLRGPGNAYERDLNCSLNFLTVTSPIVEATVHLNIVRCKLGFVYNSTQRKCTCFQSTHITCDMASGNAFVQSGYWIGHLTNRASGFVVQKCSHCDDVSNCDLTVHKNQLSSVIMCELPSHENGQCLNNRGGPYCTLCNNDSVFTLNAEMCIPKDQCNVGSMVLLGFIYILARVIIVIIFLLLLQIGCGAGSGYLYAYVYYYTIMPHLVQYPSRFLSVFITVFEDVVSLDTGFIGLLPLCSVPSFSRIHHEALQYINPMLTVVALLGISCIARYWPKLLHLSGEYTIHCVCTMILLSFTALNTISINLLKCVRLNSAFYVLYIQPDVQCFQAWDHLPFALLAIAVELLLLFPFTGLLLFAPLLIWKVNLVRIKPFLDEFQGCFHDKHRWMAGFYFLGRLILLIIAIASLPLFCINVLSVTFLFIIAALRPYKSWHLNLFDGLLLFNLCLLGLVQTYTDGDASNDRDIVLVSVATHILVISGSMYGVVLFIVIVLKAINRIFNCKRKILPLLDKFLASSHKDDEDYLTQEKISQIPCTQTNAYNPNELREPMLSESYNPTTDEG